MQEKPVIAIIGAGNMGSSLLGGLIHKGHPHEKILAADPDIEKLSQLEKMFKVHTETDNLTAVQSADVIIFAVKPGLCRKVAQDIAPYVKSHQPLIISIATGIRVHKLKEWLSDKAAIVRAMPNTPALIGCGASGLYANPEVTAEQRNLAESILRAVGIVVWLTEEKLIDAVTATSGSGPAYFFLMMEAMEQAGMQLGLTKETSHLLTLETALGAARMAIESGKSLEELRRNVTSPSGTTEKAIGVFENREIRKIFLAALTAAKTRSEELADEGEKG